jgi:hypothetical protein
MLSDSEKRRRLERALEFGGGTHAVADVAALIADGKAQLWEYQDGCIVTELHCYPRRKDVHFWTISGALSDCLALEHDILPWAIEEGCTVATACGRKGWGRVAAPTGWRQWHPNFYKPLIGSSDYGRRQ